MQKHFTNFEHDGLNMDKPIISENNNNEEISREKNFHVIHNDRMFKKNDINRLKRDLKDLNCYLTRKSPLFWALFRPRNIYSSIFHRDFGATSLLQDDKCITMSCDTKGSSKNTHAIHKNLVHGKRLDQEFDLNSCSTGQLEQICICNAWILVLNRLKKL